MMHVMQEQIDACDAIMILGVNEWSFKSFSLIKSWVRNWVSTYNFIEITICVQDQACVCMQIAAYA